MDELIAWVTDPKTLVLLASVAASAASALLPNDSWIVRLTSWLALNIGQARPGAPQEKFTRFVSGLLR